MSSDPKLDEVSDADLVQTLRFVGRGNATHGMRLATLCEALARVLERDAAVARPPGARSIAEECDSRFS